MCRYIGKIWGVPAYECAKLGRGCLDLRRVPMKKTIMLDVDISVPVEVAEEMLADRVLEMLKRDLTKAANRAVADFIVNGVTASLSDIAVKAEKRLQKAR